MRLSRRLVLLVCLGLYLSIGSFAQGTPSKHVKIMSHYESRDLLDAGYTIYYDYAEAITAAKKQKKPVLVYFTGFSNVNSRKMEKLVLAKHGVVSRLKNQFIFVALYCDMTMINLAPDERFYSETLKKPVLTLADVNNHIQEAKYKTDAQPLFYFIDANEKQLATEPYSYNTDAQKFIEALENVMAEYKKADP